MTDKTFLDDNTTSVHQIRTIPALERFSEEDLERLLSASRIETYKDGDLIISEESPPDNRVYYLVSGKVKVIKSGKELMILRRTGDVFGEIGVVSGVARSASIFAVGKATCLEVTMSHIDYLDETSRLTFKYMIYRSFAEIMANRLKKTTDELMAAHQEIERLKKK